MSKSRCNRASRGWACYLPRNHDGPCPAWPRWWNIKWSLRYPMRPSKEARNAWKKGNEKS